MCGLCPEIDLGDQMHEYGRWPAILTKSSCTARQPGDSVLVAPGGEGTPHWERIVKVRIPCTLVKSPEMSPLGVFFLF